MTKILFLDFGVLNDTSMYQNIDNNPIKQEYYNRKKIVKNFIWERLKDYNNPYQAKLWTIADLDYEKVILLNKIVKETDCKIVFSTSWRGDGVKNLALLLTLLGFQYPENCIDYTCFDRDGIRGLQISDWLIENMEFYEEIRYAILDDEMFDIREYHMQEVLFQTDGKVSGLTEEVCERVIEWLNGEDK